jgi:nucleotide-binding universal stress UspA family protein
MAGFKTILAVAGDEISGATPLETALLVGRSFGSHVTALHVRADPSNAVPLVGEGMSGVMVEEMIAAAEKQADDRARLTAGMSEALRERFGAPLLTVPPATGFSMAWREEDGREEDVVARCARLADLVVVGRPVADRELPSVMTLNAALMESGRPLLVTPPQAPTEPARRVAVAWNGSAEAARAVSAALPFLAAAEQVHVFSAQESEADPVLAPCELRAYLAWHNIAAETHSFHATPAHAGEALLQQVMAQNCDLVVMGAYTHSRLRQLILGGVTRHMLHHAGVPVLMMH